jgi:hypothetical protein
VVPLGGLFKINEITMDLEKGSCDNEEAFLEMLSPSSRQRRKTGGLANGLLASALNF